MEQMRAGVSEDQLLIDLRQRPEYRTRFAGMETRRQNGLPAISEAQYLAFEESAAAYMQRAGLPDTFYDDPSDYANLVGRFVNVEQLAERVSQGYLRVQSAPREVREAFGELYGANGDPALAMFFLDPERSMPTLERMLLGAEVYGVGRRFGYTLAAPQRERLADLGIDREAAERGFREIVEMEPLLSETISETEDFDQATALDAAFAVDGGRSRQRLRQRAEARFQAFQGGGQAAMTNQGIIGLGEAE